MRIDPKPTGSCWCGCGQPTKPKSFFRPGHDRAAESAVIKAEYGGIPHFLIANGYGPGQKRACEAIPTARRADSE